MSGPTRPWRRLFGTLAVLTLVLTACGEDAGDDASRDVDETTTTTARTTTSNSAADDLPGGRLEPCESPDGFTLGRPGSWHANERCSQLHPEPFEVPDATDERVAAITAYIDPVPFEEVAAPDPDRDADRADTTVDGLQAVRLEYETTGEALWPAGTPVTVYAVDLSLDAEAEPRTLFVDTIGLETFDYETNRIVLDRVARTLDITLDGVPTDPAVVARYGGGSGFTVEGEVTQAEACLRIPPGGRPVCTDVPGPEDLRTIQLVDLELVLAGVTGEDVFRVTAARRDGGTSTFLPARIGGSDIHGFAFTFDLDAIERLTLFDVTGAEIDVLRPGR